MTKAMFAAARVLGVDDASIRLAVPNDMHRAKCEERRAEAEQAVATAFGRALSVTLVLDAAEAAAVPVDTSGDGPAGRNGRRSSSGFDDEVIDPSELLDAHDAPVTSTKDLMLSAFPGAQLVEEERQ